MTERGQSAPADFEHAAFDGNRRFGLEGRGFDFVPESDRSLTLANLGLFWMGTNFYLFNFVIGTLAIGVGLRVWQACLAVGVGSLSYILVSLGSIAGSRSGIPTLTVSRGAFGINANRGNAFLGWFDTVLFEALNVVFAVFAATSLFDEIGWHKSGNLGKAISLACVYAISILVATLGHATVIWLQRIFGIALAIVMLAVLAFTIGHVSLSAGPNDAAHTTGSLSLFLVATSVIAAGGLAYMVTPCDFSRYLPARTSNRAHFWVVLASAGGIALFLGLMGVMLAAQGNLTNPVAGVKPLIPNWLYVIFVLSVIGGSIGNCVISLYNSGLTLQATGLPIRRYRATMLDAVVAGSLIIYILFFNYNFQNTLNDILSVLLVWVGPFGAIWLTDAGLRHWHYDADAIHSSGGRYYGRHGFRVEALAALVLGMIVAYLTMNAPVHQGILSKDWFGNGDLSWLLGPAVAAGVYLLLAGRKVRANEKTGNRLTGETAAASAGEEEHACAGVGPEA